MFHITRTDEKWVWKIIIETMDMMNKEIRELKERITRLEGR